MISTKICKEAEFGNSVYYTAICGCGSTSCEMSLKLENDDGIISLELYRRFHAEQKWYKRLLQAVKLFFGKDIELSEDFIFNNKEQIIDFSKAILEGVEKIENYKKEL